MKEEKNLTKEEMELLDKLSNVFEGKFKEEPTKDIITEPEQMSMVFAMILRARDVDFDKVIEYSEIFALWQSVWENKELRNLIVYSLSDLEKLDKLKGFKL